MKNNNILLLSILGLGAYLLFYRKGGIFGKYVKTKFMPVYVDGKPNKNLIRASDKRPGVYLIKVDGKLKYIGYSSYNVYKTITRHFQEWGGRFNDQIRITYPKTDNVTARVIYTNTGAQAIKLERALILKYRPDDNPNKFTTIEADKDSDQIIKSYEEAPFIVNDVPF
jgi:hypothetical protein